MTKHKFPYDWKLSDGYPAKGIKYHGKKVFSCFSCGGGSSMGYKLAGYDVLGCNEIDPKMAECYKVNHNPKYCFVEPIQKFKDREDMPEELFNLDILDGSPPCSSFSMAGNREKDWGKDKKFREGQKKQVLDTLFFDFIDLAKRLQPKVVIAENVKGLLLGAAFEYVHDIRESFKEAGYKVGVKLLDASRMGVPQRRERIFFYAIRNDLNVETSCLFGDEPFLDLEFNEQPILFKEIKEITGDVLPLEKDRILWRLIPQGGSQSDIDPKGNGFNCIKVVDNKCCPTITGNQRKDSLYTGLMHSTEERKLNVSEFIKAGTYPNDYRFVHSEKENIQSYLIGMSVPPVMTAQVAHRVYKQWLA